MSNNGKITEACLYENKVHMLKVSVTNQLIQNNINTRTRDLGKIVNLLLR